MTRLAVLADIHGNLPALEAVIKDMAQFKVDHVVVAGDSVNVGPFSREVLQVISERNWAVIRGNNAFYVLDYQTPRMPAHWTAFTLPPWLRDQLGAKWINFLACLPDALSLRFADAAPIRVFHGIPDNPWGAISPMSTPNDVECWLRDIPEDTIIGAHSHIPLERHIGPRHIFNPGSVGIPLDGDRRASYMVLEGDHQGWSMFAHRRVSFDHQPIFEAFEKQRFIERCGVAARLLAQEFETARMRLWPFIQWKSANYPDQPESLSLYDEFQRLEDTRPYMPPEYRDLSPRLHRD